MDSWEGQRKGQPGGSESRWAAGVRGAEPEACGAAGKPGTRGRRLAGESEQDRVRSAHADQGGGRGEPHADRGAAATAADSWAGGSEGQRGGTAGSERGTPWGLGESGEERQRDTQSEAE